MALLRIEHVPETVKVNLPLNIIVPDPGQMGDIPVSQRKVLYLLHGLSDDATAWQRYSTIEVLARQYGLVVVMPSVGRSMYIDQPNGQKYFSYITEELPEYLQMVFGLKPRREDTFIAGLSMGGYGAIKAGLLRPELYSAAASLSGVLSLSILGMDPNDPRKTEFVTLFGPLDKLPGGEHDPEVWLKRAASHPADIPRLFITCGRQDDLYPLSVQFYAACRKLGLDAVYHEEDGRHVWPFWEAQIHLILAQMLGPIPES